MILIHCASQHYPSVLHSNPGSRRFSAIGASLSSAFESDGSTSQIAPLRLESPIGQFLYQILVSHPHLIPAAVEQQLEQLQTDRDAEKKQEEPSASGTDLVLYRLVTYPTMLVLEHLYRTVNEYMEIRIHPHLYP